MEEKVEKHNLHVRWVPNIPISISIFNSDCAVFFKHFK
jgi:hypothetical protein